VGSIRFRQRTGDAARDIAAGGWPRRPNLALLSAPSRPREQMSRRSSLPQDSNHQGARRIFSRGQAASAFAKGSSAHKHDGPRRRERSRPLPMRTITAVYMPPADAAGRPFARGAAAIRWGGGEAWDEFGIRYSRSPEGAAKVGVCSLSPRTANKPNFSSSLPKTPAAFTGQPPRAHRPLKRRRARPGFALGPPRDHRARSRSFLSQNAKPASISRTSADRSNATAFQSTPMPDENRGPISKAHPPTVPKARTQSRKPDRGSREPSSGKWSPAPKTSSAGSDQTDPSRRSLP